MIEDKSLKDTVEEVRHSFRSHNPNSDAWIKPNNFWITSTVLGGKLWEIYARVRWLITNSLPDTAVGAVLDRWGNIFDVTRLTSTKTIGLLTATGTDGTLIPTGTQFIASSGIIYVSTSDATITGGQVDVTIESVEGGSKSAITVGAPIKFVSTVAGADLDTTVQSISAGLDSECDDDYRVRVINRIRRRNRYGTLKDYEDWAKEVSGVTRAWAQKRGNRIIVFFMMDDLYPLQAPPAAEAIRVQDYLTDECRKPACADVTTLLPEPITLNARLKCPTLTAEEEQIIKDEINGYLIDNAAVGLSFKHHKIQNLLGELEISKDIVVDCDEDYIAGVNELFIDSGVVNV